MSRKSERADTFERETLHGEYGDVAMRPLKRSGAKSLFSLALGITIAGKLFFDFAPSSILSDMFWNVS